MLRATKNESNKRRKTKKGIEILFRFFGCNVFRTMQKLQQKKIHDYDDDVSMHSNGLHCWMCTLFRFTVTGQQPKKTLKTKRQMNKSLNILVMDIGHLAKDTAAPLMCRHFIVL